MKILVDQGLPRSTVKFLKECGVIAVHVGDIGMASADDYAILDYARKNDYVVVTLDADFHAILALNQKESPSVIRIRIQGMKGQMLSNILQKIIRECKTELENGSAITVQGTLIRIHKLPFGMK